MRITRFVGACIVILSFHVAGCEEDPNSKPVDMKPANTAQFDEMKDQMTKNLKAAPKTAVKP